MRESTATDFLWQRPLMHPPLTHSLPWHPTMMHLPPGPQTPRTPPHPSPCCPFQEHHVLLTRWKWLLCPSFPLASYCKGQEEWQKWEMYGGSKMSDSNFWHEFGGRHTSWCKSLGMTSVMTSCTETPWHWLLGTYSPLAFVESTRWWTRVGNEQEV